MTQEIYPKSWSAGYPISRPDASELGLEAVAEGVISGERWIGDYRVNQPELLWPGCKKICAHEFDGVTIMATSQPNGSLVYLHPNELASPQVVKSSQDRVDQRPSAESWLKHPSVRYWNCPFRDKPGEIMWGEKGTESFALLGQSTVTPEPTHHILAVKGHADVAELAAATGIGETSSDPLDRFR